MNLEGAEGSYEPALCTDCLALRHAGVETPAHLHLGRARAEVGYVLHRCTVCHAHWSLGPLGWMSEAA
jgi:hypothetical protein